MNVYARGPVLIIEQARRARGWTGRQCGKESGLTAGEVSKIERGWMNPTRGQAARLAAALDLRPSELLLPAIPKEA
jgi:transcriptional regulator with XRE-family HTH domain